MAKLATCWLTGCCGCHVALLDLYAGPLDTFAGFELVACPQLMDVRELEHADVGLVEGAVGTSDDLRVLEAMRERTDHLIAVGTCACYGGLPGLRNLFETHEVLDAVYPKDGSKAEVTTPDFQDLPTLEPAVVPVDQVVDVDGYIPGCAPPKHMLREGLKLALAGSAPELARRNLCDQCPRKHETMQTNVWEFLADRVFAVCELEHIDPDLCFLEQGVPCLGFATREGCGAQCVMTNTPCRGCMGPTPDALEQGAKWINAVASLLPAGALVLQDDVVGLGYRYTLPMSVSPAVVPKEPDDE